MSESRQPTALRRTPVYNALMRKKLVFGIDADIAESLMIVTGYFVLSPLRFYYFIPVALLIWFVVLLYAKDDPDALSVLKKYVRQGDVYEPWPHAVLAQNARPVGFGRNELC